MKPSLIRKLAHVADGSSESVQLITVRRSCRLLCAEMDLIQQERRALMRNANKLRRLEPLTKLAVDMLEQQASEYKAASYAGITQSLVAIGQTTILQSDAFTAALGFDRLCDLLNINSIHRAAAAQDGHTSLHELVSVARLEDSAGSQSDHWNQDGPLYTACRLATIEFIRTAPEGSLPDPFAPGEIFGQKLPIKLHVV